MPNTSDWLFPDIEPTPKAASRKLNQQAAEWQVELTERQKFRSRLAELKDKRPVGMYSRFKAKPATSSKGRIPFTLGNSRKRNV